MADSGATRTILVVDDFPESIDAVFQLLVERGFTVCLALDGEDAIRQAQALRPDAIVMDVAMPKCDGIEALRRLKADTRTAHIPVVLFSAHAGSELHAIADAIGCAAVVRKPSGSNAVVDTIARLTAPN